MIKIPRISKIKNQLNCKKNLNNYQSKFIMKIKKNKFKNMKMNMMIEIDKMLINSTKNIKKIIMMINLKIIEVIFFIFI